MVGKLIEIFTDKNLVEKIKKRLPYLFQLAELESSRAGKTGMEVGSVHMFTKMVVDIIACLENPVIFSLRVKHRPPSQTRSLPKMSHWLNTT
jgi:hypothetical protein